MSTSIISNYLGAFFINNFLRGEPYGYQSNPNFYLALYTNSTGAGDSNSGTEVSAAGYSRQTFSRITGFDYANFQLSNNETISFSQATVNWGTIYGWGIHDAQLSGNLLFWGLFTTPVAIGVGQQLKIPAGSLIFKFNNAYHTTPSGGWTTFSSKAFLDWITGADEFNYTVDGAYLALGKDIVIDNTTDKRFSSWTEVSSLGTDYSRIFLPETTWGAQWLTVGSVYAYNLNEIIFTNNATASWGTITDIVLYDSITNTNPIYWGHLSTPATVNVNDGFRIGTRTYDAPGIEIWFR